jgi:hypothetical protein
MGNKDMRNKSRTSKKRSVRIKKIVVDVKSSNSENNSTSLVDETIHTQV